MVGLPMRDRSMFLMAGISKGKYFNKDWMYSCDYLVGLATQREH